MYLNQSDRTRKGAHYDYGDPGNQSPPSRCFPTTQKKSFWCCHSYHQSASQYQLKTRIIRNDCEMWYKKKQTTFLFRVPFNWLSNQHFSKRNHCEQAPLYPKCIWNVFFQWQIYSVWISTVMAIWCVCVCGQPCIWIYEKALTTFPTLCNSFIIPLLLETDSNVLSTRTK